MLGNCEGGENVEGTNTRIEHDSMNTLIHRCRGKRKRTFCKVVLTGLAQFTDIGIPVVLTTIVPLSPDTTEDYARRISQGRR
jgi:hypothetical protein